MVTLPLMSTPLLVMEIYTDPVGSAEAQGTGRKTADGVSACADASDKDGVISAVQAFGVWVRLCASRNGGIAVAVQIDHKADVSGRVDGTDDEAASVDNSNWYGENLGLRLVGVLIRVSGERLDIHRHGRLIKRDDLDDVRNAEASGLGLLLGVLIGALFILACHGLPPLQRL